MNIALLPAKPLHLAKTRLGPVLGARERSVLALAMFRDVLAALGAATRLDAVIVVTADRRLATAARAAGALVVDEGTPRGLNAAVRLGTTVAQRLGADTVTVVLSDVPLVSATDLDRLCARAPMRGALAVPCKDGTGTNALLRRPATILPPRFGGRSLERHVASAERTGVACEIVRSPRLAFDVDTPADLAALTAAGPATATGRAVHRLGLGSARALV